jgi:hypothetical protein
VSFAREVAKEEDISVNQLITLALAEKLAALQTEAYFEARAARGSRAKFERGLGQVARREPPQADRLPKKRKE